MVPSVARAPFDILKIANQRNRSDWRDIIHHRVARAGFQIMINALAE
jgi:hypothetical protein